MSKAITLNGALADELRREAQAQKTTVEELLGYLLQLAQSEGRRREALTQIKQISEQIAREFKPEKIILFGSYAYGIPRQGSDIDLLVIMPYEGSRVDQSVKIHQALNYAPSLDLLVRTPEEVQQRIEMGDSFMREIVKRGKILYAADHAGMDRKSRRGTGRRYSGRRGREKNPNHDAACFHAQQCVEKYLKARLQEANVASQKTHCQGSRHRGLFLIECEVHDIVDSDFEKMTFDARRIAGKLI